MTRGSTPTLTNEQVTAYLDRLAIDRTTLSTDADSLRRLQLAHLDTIPFENLDIVSGGVRHDRLAAVDKIIGSQRGGWCFEVNGAFSLLLRQLGFEVKLLGAAVLRDGPCTVIEHVLMEVSASGLEPHLVDVGFGSSFDLPLRLNTSDAQDGGSGIFELIASPQGTTVARHDEGIPTALMRFKRVAHAFGDFEAVADSMQTDPTKSWATKPFATRRLAADADIGGAGRVSLSHDHLVVRRGTDEQRTKLSGRRWEAALQTWFGFSSPLQRTE
ncbi:MAG: arylamine N-acetyltransferase [Ilumatobacter sp.]